MTRRRLATLSASTVFIAACAFVSTHVVAQSRAPLHYTVRFPAPATKTFTVDLVVPTEGKSSVDLMMPVWSPGFYGYQNYADRVSDVSAKGAGGETLEVAKSSPSRWTITTGAATSFTFTYTVAAPRGSNLSNGVTETTAVLIGPASFVTLPEPGPRPLDLALELPPTWKGSMTSLDAAPDHTPNHYVAPNYDVLADSPILAGVDLESTPFTVGGIQHYWTYLGKAEWPGDKVVEMLKPLIEEHIKFWSGLPYKKYAFLNIVTGGGGGSGVEHLNSVAITTSGKTPVGEDAIFREAAFISHEYFHAMNVKRLRPVELGPFDYEHAPVTTGLWVAEGLTSYFGDLLAARAGLGSLDEYLLFESRHISDLQTKQPGRLFQTLEQASSQMFDRIPPDKKVDYYVKGPVVGLVLDAHIRKATNGKKSMDDVMHLEYQRWSGAHGYTAEDFSKTMSDAAGVDMGPLLHKLVATTEEVDYTEMLEWFGLRFKAAAPAAPAVPAPPTATGARAGGAPQQTGPAPEWTLEILPNATAAQKAHLAALVAR